MIEATFISRKMDGVELFQLLSKHRLLPKNMEDPRVCVSLAENSEVGFLHEGERVLAVVLETSPYDGVMELIWVNEIGRLHQKKEELCQVAHDLRSRWFDQKGLSRVGVHVPVARTQTIRTLKSMGFRMETLPWGVRSAMPYGNHFESMAILGLLPSDPVKVFNKTTEDNTLSKAG